MTKPYFPISLDLTGRRCLIIGGGHEALGKARSLLEAGAQVHVISPVFLPEFADLAGAGKITRSFSTCRPGCLKGHFLAFACTSSEEINQEIAEEARRFGVLLNVVDKPDRCDFIMPAVTRHGSLTFAVSTGGKSPAFARRIKEELAAQYGAGHSDFLDLLGDLRPLILATSLSVQRRGELFTRIVRSEALERLQAGDMAGTYALIIAILKEYGMPWPPEWSTLSAPDQAIPS
ncbi:MAG TPA: bifunctional precorrin-2 dehydrogenase/sirohydrochlorin ferrochelatase [Symbiobacteriaceae bacterium]|jgi:precorrin-2 dehydrogenase/sirohydrochlorin ferrochelatase